MKYPLLITPTIDMNELVSHAIANAIALEPTTTVSLAPIAKRLSELVPHMADDHAELLRRRFLCRGGGLLVVGPTGIGKSSLALQAMILWALGRPVFGIEPTARLKSLLIQAENDDGDLVEMRDGVFAGLNLPQDEKEAAMKQVLVVREDVRTGCQFFSQTVRPMLAEHQPDLLWIDPALSYLGGEANSQKDVGGFLRRQLNPLLREFNCGVVVVHHTNKPPSGPGKSDLGGGDYAYLGTGSAEWANWARAIIAVRSLGLQSVFELRAAKRGGRLTWTLPDGQTKAMAKFIAHASKPGEIWWRETDASEIPETAKNKKVFTKADVLFHVPQDNPIAKSALRAKANHAGVAINKVNPMIAELIEDGALYEWRKARSGTKPKLLLARLPQPQPEVG